MFQAGGRTVVAWKGAVCEEQTLNYRDTVPQLLHSTQRTKRLLRRQRRNSMAVLKCLAFTHDDLLPGFPSGLATR